MDISSYIPEHQNLAKLVSAAEAKAFAEKEKLQQKGDSAPPTHPLVGFVDVEGQGSEDATYDTLLALPLLLTSKVVLFNHKGMEAYACTRGSGVVDHLIIFSSFLALCCVW